MKNSLIAAIIISLIGILSGCAPVAEKKSEKNESEKPVVLNTVIYRSASVRMTDMLKDIRAGKTPVTLPASSRIDTVKIDSLSRKIDVVFNGIASGAAFREENTSALYSLVRSYLGNDFGDFVLTIHSSRFLIEDLIPNIYRSGKYSIDLQRKSPGNIVRPVPVVENISRPYRTSKGLYSKNILVWHSHGWYYSNEDDRWLWQRPRLFEAVEDKIPMSFVLPYLVPMLENSGANVFVPRERDIQINEAITDNDDAASRQKPSYIESSKSKSIKWKTSTAPAFAYGTPPYPEGYNPFLKGTSRYIETDTVSTAAAKWIPDIPETGEYAVYISYTTSENSIDDAIYTVNHSGGSTEFRVNQKTGGSTWIYLGNFHFLKGYNQSNASVVLTNRSISGKAGIVSADAVRFGGGMGIVSRNGKTSGRPKFLEGSRYWLQFAGMPDTLVYSMRKNKDDYSDDFISRSEYGNYLKGAPYGPTRMPTVKGLGIPVDLSLALHTDAGITHSDTAIGTLSIYASDSRDKSVTFPDGQSRMASRDLADIVQSQIVEDIRKEFDPVWPRRQLMDGNYYEARSTNYPSVLVELLSHQNYQDMKFMLDPRFQFLVARSIYKSMLKYLAFDHSESYAVQPLPVTHFSAVLAANGSVNLRWRPQNDPLEPTAEPVQYIVYTRMGNGDFDNGQLTGTNELVIPKLRKGVIYSFKVTALNDGGESFPSEILSVCDLKNGKAPVLIINGFDRICGPAGVSSAEYTGFPEYDDAGVPDKYLLSYTGAQYNFNPSSAFISNDAPGHGASYADHE
ncbi:MAG: N-acetylmuramoyl-L-alanine amidase, partial [Syntrophothermus sp.]